MRVTVIRNCAQLENFKDEWQPLLDRSRPNHVFMTWEWLSSWWKCFGDSGQMFVLLVQDQHELIGALPLMSVISREEDGRAVRRLHFIGHRTSDWMDLLGARKREVISKCLQFLQKRQDLWDYLDLRSLAGDSDTLVLLEQFAAHLGFSFAKESTGKCPYMTTTSDWKTFYETRVPKELRSNLERRLRKLWDEGEVECEWPSPAALAENLTSLFELHQRRFPESKFAQRRQRQFYRELVKAFPPTKLYCPVLKVSGKIIAAEFAFRYNRKIYGYTFVHDPDYKVFSPGKVVLRYMAENCFADADVDEFDFLFGDEPYKSDWATGARDTYRILMGNRYMSGRIGKVVRRMPLAVRRPLTRVLSAARGAVSSRLHGRFKTAVTKEGGPRM